MLTKDGITFSKIILAVGRSDLRKGIDCKLRHRPDSFAEQNGRGAERADTIAL